MSSEETKELSSTTTGAWVVHHTQKLELTNGIHQFNNILIAGKAGLLLSSLSGTRQANLPMERVRGLAAAANINPLELDSLLDRLQKKKLIERSSSGVDVLGVTSHSVLERTGEIFSDLAPSNIEQAALTLAELTSHSPLANKEASVFMADSFRLTRDQTVALLEDAIDIGFIDSEGEQSSAIYFNGNLFRRDDVQKIKRVLDSLTEDERRKVTTMEAKLKANGCLLLDTVKAELGTELFSKLNAVSMYDVSQVNNSTENVAFVTRPAAFSKYGNALLDDALDLAKAFVSSLTYGMTRSSHSRGRITMIGRLMSRLINGHWVGCVQAIGEDYRALEMRGVVNVRPSDRGGFEMFLLKKDVGELALQVIKSGDASEQALLHLPSASVTGYIGPEKNRERRRKKQQLNSKRATRDVLTSIRTGGLK